MKQSGSEVEAGGISEMERHINESDTIDITKSVKETEELKFNSTFNTSKYVPETDEEVTEMQAYSILPDTIVTMQNTITSDPSILERSRTDQGDMVQTTTARTTEDLSSLISDTSIQDAISPGVLPIKKRMKQMTETFQLMTPDKAQYVIDRQRTKFDA